MNVKQERYEYTHALEMDGQVFHVREMLPCQEKEQLAQDLVSATMVFDEAAGVAYESYNLELIRAFLILVHYTDLDLSEYDTPEGRYAAQDAVASHGLWQKILDIVEQDVNNVDAIAARLRDSAKYCFERQHSLEYRLAKVFEALLGTEDLMETIAKAEDLNSKLIDMLGAVRKQPAPMAGGGLQFAKKD